MFGDGSYKATTFKTSNTGRYLYDSKTNSYIYQSYDGSNSCDITYTNILDRVYRQKDQITIVVKTKNNKTRNLLLYYYNFTESDDGNYYFTSLNKTTV